MTTNARIIASGVRPGHEPLTEILLTAARSRFHSDHGPGHRPLFLYGPTDQAIAELFDTHDRRGKYGSYPSLGPNGTPVFCWQDELLCIAEMRANMFKGLVDVPRGASYWFIHVWDGEPEAPPQLT